MPSLPSLVLLQLNDHISSIELGYTEAVEVREDPCASVRIPHSSVFFQNSEYKPFFPLVPSFQYKYEFFQVTVSGLERHFFKFPPPHGIPTQTLLWFLQIIETALEQVISPRVAVL